MAEQERFQQEKFRPILESAMNLDAVLGAKPIDIHFQDPKEGNVHIETSYGDIYRIVNALRDYSHLLLMTCDLWGLTGFQKATYEFHAQKAKEIADKYQQAIGYDYDKAVENCAKKKTKGKGANDDVGADALELMLR